MQQAKTSETEPVLTETASSTEQVDYNNESEATTGGKF